MFRAIVCSLAAVVLAALPWAQTDAGGDVKTIRVGMIGLDTSHVTAFTKILHDPKSTGDLRGFKVVAAYPAGSPDVASSRDRIEGFTKQMKDAGRSVEVVVRPGDHDRTYWRSQSPTYLRAYSAAIASTALPAPTIAPATGGQ